MFKNNRVYFVVISSVFLLLMIWIGFFIFSVFQMYFPSEKNARLKKICRRGNLTQVDINDAKYLLYQGANPNQSNFHLSESLLQLLLSGYEYKTDRNFCNELVTLLLEHGADPNEQQSEVGSFLHFAVGHPDTEKILLNHGARVGSSYYTSLNILDLAQSNYYRHKKFSSLEELELLKRSLDKEKSNRN